jgi:hypothetical protein
MREMRNAYKILVRKLQIKRLLGRSRRRWEDNIKIGPKEVGSKRVDWIHVAQYRIQWKVEF